MRELLEINIFNNDSTKFLIDNDWGIDYNNAVIIKNNGYRGYNVFKRQYDEIYKKRPEWRSEQDVLVGMINHTINKKRLFRFIYTHLHGQVTAAQACCCLNNITITLGILSDRAGETKFMLSNGNSGIGANCVLDKAPNRNYDVMHDFLHFTTDSFSTAYCCINNGRICNIIRRGNNTHAEMYNNVYMGLNIADTQLLYSDVVNIFRIFGIINNIGIFSANIIEKFEALLIQN
jgi:hypothetical protein